MKDLVYLILDVVIVVIKVVWSFVVEVVVNVDVVLSGVKEMEMRVSFGFI